MRYAPPFFSARPGTAAAARWPHSTRSHAERNGRHARRTALIASISGGRLSRLNQLIRLELTSNNGLGACERLRSGSVDCSCDYCELYWSRLEEKLRAK